MGKVAFALCSLSSPLGAPRGCCCSEGKGGGGRIPLCLTVSKIFEEIAKADERAAGLDVKATNSGLVHFKEYFQVWKISMEM